MSDIPDIEPGPDIEPAPAIGPGDDGGDSGVDAPLHGVGEVEAAGMAAATHCLSCGGVLAGPFCPWCGQKDDDMRRSLSVLARNFIEDTFAFDSRMWKTLGLMAVAPGLVPSQYTHGKRSRYTPPVRLFLMVSFLFFLVLGMTQTMFVAVEVTAKTPQEVAEDRRKAEEALSVVAPDIREKLDEVTTENQLVVIDGQTVDCDIDVGLKFFVRPKDVRFDEAGWRACSESVARTARVEIDAGVNTDVDATPAEIGPTQDQIRGGFDRAMAGVNVMVSDPMSFNTAINAWLPRVMFFMTPILALLMSVFIRGRDALLFDHVVLSFYSHSAAFAVFGVAIILGQFGAPLMLPAAVLALFVYFTAALKRAYGRGWIKTVYSSLFIGFLYMLILSTIVMGIISNRVWAVSA